MYDILSHLSKQHSIFPTSQDTSVEASDASVHVFDCDQN